MPKKKIWADEIDMRNPNADLIQPSHFNQIAEQAYSRLHNAASRILHNADDALDATQEALAKAFLSRERFNHEAAPLTWLYRIVTNEALNRIRHDKRSVDGAQVEIDSNESGVARYIMSEPRQYKSIKESQRSKLVTEAIDRLPEHQRVVVELHYFHGFKLKDIAENLGIPTNTIRAQLFRAREKLGTLPNIKKAWVTMEAERPTTLPAKSASIEYAA